MCRDQYICKTKLGKNNKKQEKISHLNDSVKNSENEIRFFLKTKMIDFSWAYFDHLALIFSSL